MLTKLKNGLDGTQLKTIALVLMVLDHIHYFFEFTGCIPTVFSMLGRLSAPLFLFCTVEGFAHTHDRKRYFIRIWAIGTAMAALEFFMIYAKAFRRGDGFYPLNAIFQDLMLLCIVWQGIDWLREKKFLHVEIQWYPHGWMFVIYKIDSQEDEPYDTFSEVYTSYLDCLEAGIIRALNII